MSDADDVAAIERRHELVLLDRLLEERGRPVPPPPPPFDPVVKGRIERLMRTIAEGVS